MCVNDYVSPCPLPRKRRHFDGYVAVDDEEDTISAFVQRVRPFLIATARFAALCRARVATPN
jgi:hypothetical protein